MVAGVLVLTVAMGDGAEERHGGRPPPHGRPGAQGYAHSDNHGAHEGGPSAWTSASSSIAWCHSFMLFSLFGFVFIFLS